MNSLAKPFATRQLLRRIAYTLPVILLLCAGVAQASSGLHWRCGWFDNTRALNPSLIDRDGEWMILAPGGRAANGRWPPRFAPSQWVRTGPRGYGYGCACLRVQVDDFEGLITRITASYSRPLAVCRKDVALAERDNFNERYEHDETFDDYHRLRRFGHHNDERLDDFE